jgi:phage tail sheath protein FI
MAFMLSPGVEVKEVDLTTVVPSVATSIGGFVGNFQWGPVLDIKTMSNEDELVALYGKPNSNTAVSFFSAANFLAYSNNLKVVRAVGSAARNAAANANASIVITNEDDYIANFSAGSAARGEFGAKYPGALGNTLSVEVADAATFASWDAGYKALFTSAPATSDVVAAAGGAHDELHVVVVDENGAFTGTAGTILETFPFVSKAAGAKSPTGANNFYKDVVNGSSKYVWWLSHPTDGTNWGSAATTTFANLTAAVSVSLAGGIDAAPVDADLIAGYDIFANDEAVDVNFLITGAANATVASEVIEIAEDRKDCVAFISPPIETVVGNLPDDIADDIVTYRDTLTSSSYAVMDSGWKYQYDKYNDTYRWIPLNADVAGLCARTDLTNDPWWSPGGLNRGIIKNVVKLAYSPDRTDRDNLYPKGINPVVTFPGQGTVLYGDKTLLARPSAFDRINVRRLFIVLEEAIATAAKYSLFEFNDAFTRAQFVALVEPYLRGVQGRRGITDFRVVCNETNNTPEVIDRNEFVASIFIKPARSINFITLNFVAVRTGVSFDEVVGSV